MRPLFLLLLVLALVLPATRLHAQESVPPASDAPPAEATTAPTSPAPETPPPGEPAPKPTEPEYDEIVVKGSKLQGHVVSFGEKSLTFETIYGKGEIEIQYTDIQAITTQHAFRFIERDGDTIRGRVAQVSSRDLVVANKSGEVKLIKPADIERVVPELTPGATTLDKMHYKFPFTTVKFDLGWNLESGAVDKVEFSGGINVERRKAPTRYVFDARVAYDYDKKSEGEGEDSVVTKDEYRASLIGEYDLKGGSRYAFIFPVAERDAPRNVLLRAYPSAGMGFRLAQTGKLRFQVQGGLAYVYEEFIDYPDNEYVALHLGFEGGYDFTSNYGVTWKTYYYPGLEDYTQNWLFRTEMIFDAKITEALSVNLRLADTLDNTPAPDVGDNKFTTTLSLLFTF